MRKSTVLTVTVAFVLGGVVGALALLVGQSVQIGRLATTTPKPVFTEVAWPFNLDEWGKGKAFHCKSADCGTEVDVYIRAKIGFCNCTTGVSDDEELERLSDFNLMGRAFTNLGDGRPIAVAWMKGRSRAYAISNPVRTGQSALSIAFNDRCDAIVATVVVGHDRPAAIEPGTLEFLNSKIVLRWAEVTLGL